MLDREYIEGLRRDIVFDTTLRGFPLRFHSTWGIFSPREIDAGTHLLLDHIEVGEADRCFDLGCGYGPLGIALAKLAPQGHSLMVDRDFISVEYARKNIAANALGNAEALLSNGFDQIGERRFDCVVSNIPAKVGKEMLHLLLFDAWRHLEPGGRIWVVTITGLRRFIERNFKEVFGNYDKVKQGKDYTVAMAVRE